MQRPTEGFVMVPLEPPDSLTNDFDMELFELCRDDDYRELYRVLVRRVAETIDDNWPRSLLELPKGLS